MDLRNCDSFPLLDVELDLSGSRHGGGSLALCHRGGVKDDFIYAAAVLRTVVMSSLFPFPGSAITASFPSWRLISAASVTASSSLAVIATYDNSSLRDFECLILF
jgi:hypothetical protein